ncbi:hypothetical protein Zm00014a_031501 [Zea mays]|uniref:Uncharacterized protein n=1 Tax=Zea mays TaxID=4577 RepID=A0A317YIT4_MAIZE|nr:hypothetical protein Zm00014a_031501 [Zea mays]
MDKITRDI